MSCCGFICVCVYMWAFMYLNGILTKLIWLNTLTVVNVCTFHTAVLYTEEPVCLRSILLSRSTHLFSVTDHYSLLEASVKLQTVVACSSIHLSCLLFLWRVKMPFHHVRAGLLYTDNFLSTSLSETSEEQLANISTEELGGEWVCVCFVWMAAICLSVKCL